MQIIRTNAGINPKRLVNAVFWQNRQPDILFIKRVDNSRLFELVQFKIGDRRTKIAALIAAILSGQKFLDTVLIPLNDERAIKQDKNSAPGNLSSVVAALIGFIMFIHEANFSTF